jgi:hypothetical protein
VQARPSIQEVCHVVLVQVSEVVADFAGHTKWEARRGIICTSMLTFVMQNYQYHHSSHSRLALKVAYSTKFPIPQLFNGELNDCQGHRQP